MGEDNIVISQTFLNVIQNGVGGELVKNPKWEKKTTTTTFCWYDANGEED
jgi:hypothetical protein